MRRRKLSACAARSRLKAEGLDLSDEFHALRRSEVDVVVDVARAAGYRKSKNAPGSRARMFYQYMQRKKC